MSTNSRRKVDQGRLGLFIARAGNKVDICRESYFRRFPRNLAREPTSPRESWIILGPPPLEKRAASRGPVLSRAEPERGRRGRFIGSPYRANHVWRRFVEIQRDKSYREAFAFAAIEEISSRLFSLFLWNISIVNFSINFLCGMVRIYWLILIDIG